MPLGRFLIILAVLVVIRDGRYEFHVGGVHFRRLADKVVVDHQIGLQDLGQSCRLLVRGGRNVKRRGVAHGLLVHVEIAHGFQKDGKLAALPFSVGRDEAADVFFYPVVVIGGQAGRKILAGYVYPFLGVGGMQKDGAADFLHLLAVPFVVAFIELALQLDEAASGGGK